MCSIEEIVISGGFEDPEKVTSAAGIDVSPLQATHEEADTRILLHAADATMKGFQRLIIQCRDTDVLLLLLVFANQLSQEVWMKAGTAKKPRDIKVHQITLPNEMLDGLLAFHAITGCDTTSQFTGIGKRTAWKVFQQYPHLLHNFGEDEVPSTTSLSLAEQFVCKLYDLKSTSNSIQEVRCALFRKLKANVDTLPPTEDALSMHLKRAHYQTKVWKQSLVTHPQLPSPINCGWQMLVPMLLTKEPVQSTCVQLTVCGCKESGSQCSTRQCLCRRRGLYCSGACGCAHAAWCMNSNDIQETNGEETDLDLDVVVRPPEKSTSTTRSSVCDAQPSTSARVLRAQGRTDRRL
ncbi:hypothetical protein KUCAC02_024665 [Chaenocephalus aceratus]|uniref:Uncharacterized protein n=1 Tax=Chaenocephalus aceratus TaxID=36190 RepID=A0ACB9WJE6_CHAAC|nr:hypothetical protein KUCAC02_024665 [Chaenocephalus aceratus]